MQSFLIRRECLISCNVFLPLITLGDFLQLFATKFMMLSVLDECPRIARIAMTITFSKRFWKGPVSPRAASRCQCHSVSSEIRTKITRLQVARINGKNGRADPNKCEAEVLAATKRSLNSKHMINDPVIALIGMNVLLTSWPANCGSLHVFFTSIASQWAEVL